MSARKRPDIMAPRLSSGRAVRPVPHLEIEDDGVYTDMYVVHGRLANRAVRNVRFERVHLHDTDLNHTRLDGLVLADVRLEGCDLANSAWRGASIDRVELIGCRLTGLDLAGAVIDPIQLVALARTLASLAGIIVRGPHEEEKGDC